jgi:oligopeptide/dipeptide ABC transporter ATP-binding protein
METEPLLRVNSVKKYFPVKKGFLFSKTTGNVKAVDDVSFDIQAGETVALAGESGCGKTTTAKLILGLERPTDGEILLTGQDIHTVRGEAYHSYRRRVQAVFQDPWSSLNPRMRIWETVAEALIVGTHTSRPEIRDRVRKVLTDVGLDPVYATRFPHEFSGGQRQRIAVAAALASEPELIVLDEPVSALDVSIRAQIMNLFRDIQQQYGVSYLLIVHDLATARYMAHEIAIMYLGKVVEYAPTEELFQAPMHPYTKALFSAALPSHPSIETDEIVLEGEVPSPIDPPPGCPFHTRCPMKIGTICETQTPRLAPHPSGSHLVSCHLYGATEQQ